MVGVLGPRLSANSMEPIDEAVASAATFAAERIMLTSFVVMALDTNHASNAEGGRHTP